MADANDVQARVKAALDFLLQQSADVVRSVDGYAPDASGNVDTKRLPLSGGTMTGVIQHSNVIAISKETNDSLLQINGGKSWDEGGSIELYGIDHSSKAGFFSLYATNGSDVKQLIGRPDGCLEWGGKQVERVNSSGTNWIRYENGIQICWGHLIIPSSSIKATVIFPVSFANSDYSPSVSYDDPDAYNIVTTAGWRTSTYMTVGCARYDGIYGWDRGVIWHAIGKWK